MLSFSFGEAARAIADVPAGEFVVAQYPAQATPADLINERRERDRGMRKKELEYLRMEV